ncbi:MAG: 2-oxoacid:ferredoxin oxidoreductase subunit beta [Pseudomonadota bacterium]
MTDLSFKDFATDQEVRWCPGCGDYAILKGVHRALADGGSDPANTVFVSGIGCSSRLPYYVDTYGFHTIHGRAPAFATGIKLANPELEVWLVTGDGDGLSIGGNHLLHTLRRNVDMNVLLFNNEIYGLTKGQYSPTSREGTISPSSPSGSFEQPIAPGQFALGAGATFFARAVDIDQKGMPGLFVAAKEHKGTSFVEILQNCIVYNKDVFDDVAARKTAAETQVHVEHGEPLLYGKEQDKGLRLNTSTLQLEAVTLGEDGITLADIAIHDETNRVMANMLADLKLPTAMGVIYRVQQQPFDEGYWQLHPTERRRKVKELIHTGDLLDRRV